MGTGRNRFSINLLRGPARWILALWLASNETFVMLLLGSIIDFLFHVTQENALDASRTIYLKV